MENLVIYVIVSFIALLITLYIAKSVFLVAKNDRIQSAQLKLLAEIAAKSGVESSKIEKVLKGADGGFFIDEKKSYIKDENFPVIRQDLPTGKTNA